MSSIGDRLKEAREEKGYSQPELAKAIGCSASNISQLESGAIQSSSHMVHIAKVLDVSPFWLVFNTQPKRISSTDLDPESAELLKLVKPLPVTLRRELIGALKLLISQAKTEEIKRLA